tara:strand:- start:6882 stop:7508 length:627 start_codon:yes stop_codon:yes gene_type:complete
MPLNLVLSAALASAESVVNKALELDPLSKKKLLKLSGKNIAITCTSPSLSLMITITEQGFALSPVQTLESDAEVSGTAATLLQLLMAKDKTKTIRTNAVQIKGDASSIQDLQVLLNELNIDWDYQLSKFIGDIPTQSLSNGLKYLKEFLHNSSESLKTDIDEYIHEEINLFPSADELELFYQRIDTLRLRLDRSQARISKLSVPLGQQ